MAATFTKTQEAMLAVLADGFLHTKQELHKCLPDELQPLSGIKAHLTHLRKKLRPIGQDILCVVRDHQFYYQQVRLLNHEDE